MQRERRGRRREEAVYGALRHKWFYAGSSVLKGAEGGVERGDGKRPQRQTTPRFKR